MGELSKASVLRFRGVFQSMIFLGSFRGGLSIWSFRGKWWFFREKFSELKFYLLFRSFERDFFLFFEFDLDLDLDLDLFESFFLSLP